MRVMVAFSAFVTGRNSIGESSSLLYFSKIALRVVIGGAFCFWILIRLSCFFMPHKVCQIIFLMVLLFRYVKRGLAEDLKEDPPAIRLLFEPKGRPEDENNEFYIQSKTNRCVGCGESSHYLRYRVIPSCYRQYFPEHLKSHRSHDIVLLCVDCHEIAHRAAEKHKREIALEFGVPLFAQRVVDSSNEGAGKGEIAFLAEGDTGGVSPLQLRSAAMALSRHGPTMPVERRKELEEVWLEN